RNVSHLLHLKRSRAPPSWWRIESGPESSSTILPPRPCQTGIFTGAASHNRDAKMGSANGNLSFRAGYVGIGGQMNRTSETMQKQIGIGNRANPLGRRRRCLMARRFSYLLNTSTANVPVTAIGRPPPAARN